MTTIRLSTRGRLTIPDEIRKTLGWEAGDEISVELRGDEVTLRRVTSLPKTTLRDFVGSLDYDGPAKSVEEMEAGIAEGVRRRWRSPEG